jgi:hypothetical protein
MGTVIKGFETVVKTVMLHTKTAMLLNYIKMRLNTLALAKPPPIFCRDNAFDLFTLPSHYRLLAAVSAGQSGCIASRHRPVSKSSQLWAY